MMHVVSRSSPNCWLLQKDCHLNTQQQNGHQVTSSSSQNVKVGVNLNNVIIRHDLYLCKLSTYFLLMKRVSVFLALNYLSFIQLPYIFLLYIKFQLLKKGTFWTYESDKRHYFVVFRRFCISYLCFRICIIPLVFTH